MDDIQLLIQDAAEHILPTLTDDQLRRRLARRSTPTLQRPPRAWCVAVRASDTRITPWNAALVPEDATNAHDLDHPGRLLPHTVTLDKRLLTKLCQPVHLQPGATLKQLCRTLGSTPDGLKSRRLKNVFRTEFQRCARGTIHGNVIPVFSADEPLDPTAHLFALPDPAWTWTARSLITRVPDTFTQDLTRIAVYRPRTTHFDKPDPTHPEHPANDAVKPHRSARFPRPPPDYVWYKWKGDVYMGYDWRNPVAAANFIRRQRKLERQRASNRRFRQRHYTSKAAGSLQFRGWRWLCPGCNKPAKVLLLPCPPINLIEPTLFRSTIKQLSAPPDHARTDPHDWYPRTFACKRCHNPSRFSRAQRCAWNQLIAYLTGGLLYGREVPKPADFHRRKLPFRPRTGKPAHRRQQVLRRLLNGWTTRQIRRDLNMSRVALDHHIKSICRQENVKNRHQLARKLNSPHPQPLNRDEHAARRRDQILPLLLQGKTYPQIAADLSLSFELVRNTIHDIYRRHGVNNSGQNCRQRLAEKLNHPLPPLTMKRRGVITSGDPVPSPDPPNRE